MGVSPGYVKTPRGLEEIRHRGALLDRPMRNLLLCIDGRRDMAALQALVKACGAPQDALRKLESLGLIAMVATPPEPSHADPCDATGPDTLQPMDTASGFGEPPHDDGAQLRARMIDLIEAHLDPLKTYTLHLDIERCNTAHALRALLPDLEAALSKVLGMARARALLTNL